MSIEIDILNGDASWKEAEPLYNAIWPPEVVAKLPWAGVVSAHADLRVLVKDETDEVVCHVGIYRRELTWDGRKLRAGGIGGVLTREDKRRHGYATIALDAAIRTLKTRARRISRFCSASRIMRRSTPRAAGSRSTARSLPNSRAGGFASRQSCRMSLISVASFGRARSIFAACPGENGRLRRPDLLRQMGAGEMLENAVVKP